MRSAKCRYMAGATLIQIAKDLGITRQRLAVELRSRGVHLRGQAPSNIEVDEMVRRYGSGESLGQVGSDLNFSPQYETGWYQEESNCETRMDVSARPEHKIDCDLPTTQTQPNLAQA